MCGITGVLSKNNEKNLMYTNYINNLQIRRGPDHTGVYKDNNIVFGHTRLSIQDINTNANQPYVYKHLVMVYNGEIYNYQDLKKELIKDKNEVFITNSDTELLIKMFYYYDKDLVLNKLEGMFAIALYNKNTNILTLIRDRLGEKPLHYYNEGDIFIFASMPSPIVKVLNKHENKKFKIDYECLNYYLSSGTFYKGKTLFSNVYSLEPAQILEINIENKIINTKLWWTPNLSENTEYNLIEVKNIIKKSVEDCEIGDRPGMLLFSGGNDSGVVSLFLKKYQYLTLCNGEEQNATEFLKNLNKDEKITYINEEFLKNNCDKVFKRHRDIIDFSGLLCRSSFPVILTTLYLEKNNPDVKIILTGNGGDELFYGYKHMSCNVEDIDKHINTLFYYCHYWDTTNETLKKISENFKKNIPEIIKNIHKPPLGLSDKNYGRWFELNHYLSGDLNLDSDITFMYSSIECRTPYLNSKLIEKMLSIDPDKFFYKEKEIETHTSDLDYENVPSTIQFTNKSKKHLKEILLGENISKKNIFREKYGYGWQILPDIIKEKAMYFRKELEKKKLIKIKGGDEYFNFLVTPLYFFFESFDYLLSY